MRKSVFAKILFAIAIVVAEQNLVQAKQVFQQMPVGPIGGFSQPLLMPQGVVGQTVVMPQGVVGQTVVMPQGVVGQTLVNGTAGCNCNLPHPPNDHNCNQACKQCWRFRPTIVQCPPECKEIPVTIVPGSPPEINEPDDNFYKNSIPQKISLDLPVVVKKRVQELFFRHEELKNLCGDVAVCVPCKECWTATCQCKLVPTQSDVEFKVRRDDKVDVWVKGTPGYPKEWIYQMCLTKKEVESQFKVVIP